MGARKQIDFLGMNPKPADLRFIENEVEDWLKREGESGADYFVRVERKSSLRNFRSQILIRSAGQEWSATESGRSLYSSVIHALQHLQQVSSFRHKRMEGESHASTI